MNRTKRIEALASDLDGTLLPLENNQDNQNDLSLLVNLLLENSVPIVFASGRPLWSVREALQAKDLPRPSAIIANVGTEIYACSGSDVSPISEYWQHLEEIASAEVFEQADMTLKNDERLIRQEENKQGSHKLSFYCRASQTLDLAPQYERWLDQSGLPLSIVASIDPFSDQGFIDFLPHGVDKNFALRWWCHSQGVSPESVVYAGDSGNDLAAMQSGFLTILVGNASEELRSDLLRHHEQRFGDRSRIYLARTPATSGVLEGLQYFLKRDTMK